MKRTKEHEVRERFKVSAVLDETGLVFYYLPTLSRPRYLQAQM